jgi:hypothetical protein
MVMAMVSKYFSKKEMQCKCCGLLIVDELFLNKIDFAREKAGIPFPVNSGCRCDDHNKSEGGKPTSDHLTGQGIDVQCDSSFARWRIMRGAMAAGIRRIGVGKTFIHLGDNLNNPSPRIWIYK